MTKPDFIAQFLLATYQDLRVIFDNPNAPDYVEAIQSVCKSLRNIANELEKQHGKPKRNDDGGETVTNPHPAPVMPPQGQSDPLAAIQAMLSRS